MTGDWLQLDDTAGMDPDPDEPVPLWRLFLFMVPGLLIGAAILRYVLK